MAFRHLNIYSSLLRRRQYSAAAISAPVLLDFSSTTPEESATLQLFSWGRGASGQLGGGVEESRIYPSPVVTLRLPPNFRLSDSTPGRLSRFSDSNGSPVEVGISCGLFHSGLVVDGQLWIWGKGDGGRLGFGHENSVFVPTLNSHLESHIRSVALGGLHSVALDSLGRVFTCFSGVMADLVLLDILCITESFYQKWSKDLGLTKYVILLPVVHIQLLSQNLALTLLIYTLEAGASVPIGLFIPGSVTNSLFIKRTNFMRQRKS